MDRSKRDFRAALTRMKDEGLEFTDCIEVFGVASDTDPYARAAIGQYGEEGSIEVDSTTVLSENEDGAYVLGWMFVGKDTLDTPSH